MTRLLPILVLALTTSAMTAPASPSTGSAQQPQPQQEPPEEDESYIRKEYAFNPLQAEKEFKIGEFYMKKGSYPAAIGRFREATRWNPGYADAWLRLGEALEKSKDPDGAREAYGKFLELAPDHKKAAEVRKKMEKKRTGSGAVRRSSNHADAARHAGFARGAVL